jgi:hypothetical protein
MVVKAYNEAREHGGINGLTPSKMFLQRSIKSDIYTKKKGQDSDDKRPPNSHIRHGSISFVRTFAEVISCCTTCF